MQDIKASFEWIWVGYSGCFLGRPQIASAVPRGSSPSHPRPPPQSWGAFLGNKASLVSRNARSCQVCGSWHGLPFEAGAGGLSSPCGPQLSGRRASYMVLTGLVCVRQRRAALLDSVRALHEPAPDPETLQSNLGGRKQVRFLFLLVRR